MSYSNALEYLTSKFQEERESLTAQIVQGALSEAEYKRLCGMIQGLDLAKNYIKDLAKRLEREDE